MEGQINYIQKKKFLFKDLLIFIKNDLNGKL